MRPRRAILATLLAFFITACNITLAADVTPPPDYIAPTPMPTLGPLFPAAAPDVANGAAIYAEKCAACHGETGLGDGEQGKQLPVTVAAFALPETARKASPAAWYRVVSQGNLDRFMPPFTSLSEQERWDVVAYTLTLHTSPDQLERGRALFEADCAGCAARFEDQESMAALSADDLVRIIRDGEGDLPAFGSSLTDEDAYAVAAYLRSLTFAGPPEAADAATATTAAEFVGTGTPFEAGTPPSEATPPGTPSAGLGTILGSIDNRSGIALPPGLTVTLREYDHGSDPGAGPLEVGSLEAPVDADGSFRFDGLNFTENRIYLAELEWEGLTYRSEFEVIEAGMAEVSFAPIVVYPGTTDYSILRVDALQMYFDFANAQDVQMLAVYSILNPADRTVLLELDPGGEIPFIKMPTGAASVGFEATQDSEPFIPTADGVAMPPSESPYGLIAFASLPKGGVITVEQPVVLPVGRVTLLVPEGVTAEGAGLTDNGPHEFQGGTFIMYTAAGLAAGETIQFTLSGQPEDVTVSPDLTQNQNLLVGVGALGLVLILAGVWLYLRDRGRTEEDTVQAEDDDPDSIMDAIIALDDLHRAGKLPDESHKQRRAELMNALKRRP